MSTVLLKPWRCLFSQSGMCYPQLWGGRPGLWQVIWRSCRWQKATANKMFVVLVFSRTLRNRDLFLFSQLSRLGICTSAPPFYLLKRILSEECALNFSLYFYTVYTVSCVCVHVHACACAHVCERERVCVTERQTDRDRVSHLFRTCGSCVLWCLGHM